MVNFSDEGSIKWSRSNSRKRVWRRPNERFADVNIQEVNRYGGGSVMIWGMVARNYKSDVVVVEGNMNGQRYLQNVVTPIVIPRSQQIGATFTFMQDNAPCHRSRLVKTALADANITLLDWPAMSPDCNPIEHVWAELKRRLNQRDPPPTTVVQLRQAATDVWNDVPLRFINNLIDSMKSRIQAVITSQGGHTKY